MPDMKSLQELGDRHQGHATATAARPKAGRAVSLKAGRWAVQTRSDAGGQCRRSRLRREWAGDKAGDRGEAVPRNGGGPGARLPRGGPCPSSHPRPWDPGEGGAVRIVVYSVKKNRLSD